MDVQLYMHMNNLERWYLQALERLNLADVARETGRGYRTLHAYMRGERRVTREAAKELVDYLRTKADTFTTAAEEIQTALDKEANEP